MFGMRWEERMWVLLSEEKGYLRVMDHRMEREDLRWMKLRFYTIKYKQGISVLDLQCMFKMLYKKLLIEPGFVSLIDLGDYWSFKKKRSLYRLISPRQPQCY